MYKAYRTNNIITFAKKECVNEENGNKGLIK